MKKIWVDMDGVLCNFEKRYTEINGVSPKDIGFSKDHWLEFVNQKGFETLEYVPGAVELLHHLQEIQDSGAAHLFVLSSSGGLYNHGEVQRQKLKWLLEHGITFHPMIVPGRRYKKGFADRDSILIDDHIENINDFVGAGGVGIFHDYNDWQSSIKLLDLVF